MQRTRGLGVSDDQWAQRTRGAMGTGDQRNSAHRGLVEQWEQRNRHRVKYGLGHWKKDKNFHFPHVL